MSCALDDRAISPVRRGAARRHGSLDVWNEQLHLGVARAGRDGQWPVGLPAGQCPWRPVVQTLDGEALLEAPGCRPVRGPGDPQRRGPRTPRDVGPAAWPPAPSAPPRSSASCKAAAGPPRSGKPLPSSAGSPRPFTCSPTSTTRPTAGASSPSSTAPRAATRSPGPSSTASGGNCASATAKARKTSPAPSAWSSTPGLVINAIVLWNTRYQDAALAQLRRDGHDVRDDDVRRLSPLGHDHINLLGRYQFSATDLLDSGLRPLHDPGAPET